MFNVQRELSTKGVPLRLTRRGVNCEVSPVQIHIGGNIWCTCSGPIKTADEKLLVRAPRWGRWVLCTWYILSLRENTHSARCSESVEL